MQWPIAEIGLILTLVASLWKTFSVIASFEKQMLKLEMKHDHIELFANGVKERAEHLAARVGRVQEIQERTLDEIESYLQKNTSYERRNRSD